MSAGSSRDIAWRDVRVGQVLRVQDDELFPADLLCLHSALPDKACFIKTTNLDGARASVAPRAVTCPELWAAACCCCRPAARVAAQGWWCSATLKPLEVVACRVVQCGCTSRWCEGAPDGGTAQRMCWLKWRGQCGCL